MQATVEEIVQAARDESEHFGPNRVPDSVLIGKLDRFYRRLYFRTQKVNGTIFSATTTFDFPLSNFDSGQTIPEYKTILGGDVVFDANTDNQNLNIVPFESRYDPNMDWPAYILDRELYFCPPETAWSPVDEVVLFYVPEPTKLTELDDTPDLPESGEPVLVQYLARFMAKRVDDVTQKMEVFQSDYQDALADYLEEIGQGESRAETTTWGEDW